jgi:tetraacyldisaccharide 4'-kinase
MRRLVSFWHPKNRIFATVKILRILLWPVSLLYGFAVWLRNRLFDAGLLKSATFSDIALIGVGNLTAGGTGKTPHVEYIVRLLMQNWKVATLSRGYGRSTRGFILADPSSDAAQIGDEPMQFRRRFPETVPVAVDARRVHGVKQLKEKFAELQTIVLDDVFQHRRIKPGLQILLTDYNRPFYKDQLLPTGMLRESKAGMKRADIIIVTKTPAMFSPLERKRIMREINAGAWQQIYFSTIRYGELVPFGSKPGKPLLSKEYYFERGYSIVLLTGIANASVLEYELRGKVKELVTLNFADHHAYTVADLQRLRNLYDNLKTDNKLILTTEKDAMRLLRPELMEAVEGLPVFYIPIEVAFHDKDAENFNQQITDYVRSYHQQRKPY